MNKMVAYSWHLRSKKLHHNRKFCFCSVSTCITTNRQSNIHLSSFGIGMGPILFDCMCRWNLEHIQIPWCQCQVEVIKPFGLFTYLLVFKLALVFNQISRFGSFLLVYLSYISFIIGLSVLYLIYHWSTCIIYHL